MLVISYSTRMARCGPSGDAHKLNEAGILRQTDCDRTADSQNETRPGRIGRSAQHAGRAGTAARSGW
jgi:hypothetical protein